MCSSDGIVVIDKGVEGLMGIAVISINGDDVGTDILGEELLFRSAFVDSREGESLDPIVGESTLYPIVGESTIFTGEEWTDEVGAIIDRDGWSGEVIVESTEPSWSDGGIAVGEVKPCKCAQAHCKAVNGMQNKNIAYLSICIYS